MLRDGFLSDFGKCDVRGFELARIAEWSDRRFPPFPRFPDSECAQSVWLAELQWSEETNLKALSAETNPVPSNVDNETIQTVKFMSSCLFSLLTGLAVSTIRLFTISEHLLGFC
ncbi:hypothetical protein BLNAU_20476 [Blattamonas nauphoetae]|uniref:Uncharacterized protein n=1 Tax=Blattamonas nauphoetae TaxID=2049346 RepID=A0ABQ9WYR9_9EUKA|nr:hypothetical protein BLNAU_20476 [Blattamonas nauphoetae]